MNSHNILTDIHALEEEILEFERKYGVRSEVFYAAYMNGEEPEDDSWVLDFGEWASIYRTWLTRQAEYRNQISSKYQPESNPGTFDDDDVVPRIIRQHGLEFAFDFPFHGKRFTIFSYFCKIRSLFPY